MLSLMDSTLSAGDFSAIKIHVFSFEQYELVDWDPPLLDKKM